MAEQLTVEIQVLDDALRASEEDIAKLQGKLREARTKQANVQTRLESANNRYRLREMYAGPKTQEAFSRFDVLERRVDDAEGRAEAMGLGTVKTLDEGDRRAAPVRPRRRGAGGAEGADRRQAGGLSGGIGNHRRSRDLPGDAVDYFPLCHQVEAGFQDHR